MTSFSGDKHERGHRFHDFFVFLALTTGCCDGVCTVHYRTYDRTYEFSARNGPNREAQFFATAFLDENRSNRKNNQTNTNRMMGWIEKRPNKFLNRNFIRQTLPPKQSMFPFNFTSLICGRHCGQCGHLWPTVAICGHCGHLWPSVAKCGQMWHV